MKKTKIFAFEGIDGSGKTVVSSKVVEYLKNKGLNVLVADFPNYDSVFGKLIGNLLSGEGEETALTTQPKVMASLYAMDRFLFFKNIDINEYDVVIMNRSTFSNVAFQTSRVAEDERENFIEWLIGLEFKNLEIPEIDKVFYLQVSEEMSKKNVAKKNKDMRSYTENTHDVYENNKNLLNSAKKVYDFAGNKFKNFSTVVCEENSEMKDINIILDTVLNQIETEMNIVHIEENNIACISDIHGHFEQLNKLVNKVAYANKFVFLGDYIDRGKDSIKVIQLVKNLVENNKAYAIKGNHEVMLIDYLENHYLKNAEDLDRMFIRISKSLIKEVCELDQKGVNALTDFEKRHYDIDEVSILFHRNQARKILDDFVEKCMTIYKKEIDFIKNLPLAIKNKNHLYVHAGVPQDLTSFNELSKINLEDLYWIRLGYLENTDIKVEGIDLIVTGHTPYSSVLPAIFEVHTDIKANIEVNEGYTLIDDNKIVIDGGAGWGKFLTMFTTDFEKNEKFIYAYDIRNDKLMIDKL